MHRIQRGIHSFSKWLRSPRQTERTERESEAEPSSQKPHLKPGFTDSGEQLRRLSLSKTCLSLYGDLRECQEAQKYDRSHSYHLVQKTAHARETALDLLTGLEGLLQSGGSAGDKGTADLLSFYHERLQVLEKQTKGNWDLKALRDGDIPPLHRIATIRQRIQQEQQEGERERQRAQSLTARTFRLEQELKQMGESVHSVNGVRLRMQQLRGEVAESQQALKNGLEEVRELLKRPRPDDPQCLLAHYFDLVAASQLLGAIKRIADPQFIQEEKPASVDDALKGRMADLIGSLEERGLNLQARCRHVMEGEGQSLNRKQIEALLLVQQLAETYGSGHDLRVKLAEVEGLFPIIDPRAWAIFKAPNLSAVEKVQRILPREIDTYFENMWDKGQGLEHDARLVLLRFLGRQLDPTGVQRLTCVEEHPEWSPERKANALAYLTRLLTRGPWRVAKPYREAFQQTLREVSRALTPPGTPPCTQEFPPPALIGNWMCGSVSDQQIIVLAEDLARYHAALFCQLTPQELACPDFLKSSLSLKACSDQFNLLSSFVTDTILMGKTPPQRAAAILNWVRVGEAGALKGDLFGAFSVVAGLTRSSVTRLKDSWDLLDDEGRARSHKLQNIFSPSNVFKAMRNFQRRHPVVYVPLVSEITKQLTMASEVSNARHRQIRGHVLTQILQQQQALRFFYQGSLEAHAATPILQALGAHEAFSEGAKYQLSIKREPPIDKGATWHSPRGRRARLTL